MATQKSYMHIPVSLSVLLSQYIVIAVIGVEPTDKYSFVKSGTQTRLKGQYNANLTLSPQLHVKPLITAIRAIRDAVYHFYSCEIY